MNNFKAFAIFESVLWYCLSACALIGTGRLMVWAIFGG